MPHETESTNPTDNTHTVEMIGRRMLGAIEPSVVDHIRNEVHGNQKQPLTAPLLGSAVVEWAREVERIEACATTIVLALKGMNSDGWQELADVVRNGISRPAYDLLERMSVAVADSPELSVDVE